MAVTDSLSAFKNINGVLELFSSANAFVLSDGVSVPLRRVWYEMYEYHRIDNRQVVFEFYSIYYAFNKMGDLRSI